jgi:hypothetical protein
LILRPEWNEVEDSTAIHLGLVASASQLLNDALVREKIEKEAAR